MDTSGSISDERLQEQLSELQGILEAYDCSLTVIYHHTHPYRVQQWRSTDGPLALEPTESGGTSHIPAFELIEREGLDAACIVCFTDMESEFPSKDPGIPTLWCDTGKSNVKAPFGRLVKID